MKVLFQSRTNLFEAPGGDTIQILKTKEFLEKLGVEVDVSLEFEPDLSAYDLVHLFNLMEPQDVYLQMCNAKRQGKKIALSTIYGLYTEFERKARGGLFQKVANILSPYQIAYIKVMVKHLAEKRFHKGVMHLLYKGYHGLMKEIVDNTHVFLPNSLSEMNRVASEFKLASYHFYSIPNAIDKGIFAETTAPKKFAEFEGCILCAARIEGRKSTLNLIKAVSGTKYTLVLAGKESQNQKKFVADVHNAAGSNVVFLGPVSHTELSDLYARAKVHALVSWMETPGLSSLEAAAMGCNIVVTPKGDTFDYFGNDAFYCEPDDIESIKNAIEEAYAAPFNTGLQQRILNNYIWENTAAETLKAYESVLVNSA